MKMNSTEKPVARVDGANAARLCMWIFLGALILSFLYILVTGRFNGDFHGVEVTLSVWWLTFSFVASVIPYFFCYWLYLKFSRNARAPTVRVGNALLGISFFSITTWFIFLAIKYNVGVLGLGVYEATEFLTPLIQITNRISPYYLGVFFIVGYKGSRATIALGVLLLITLGVLRAGLGVFIYILLALVIRNHQQIRGAFRNHLIKIILIVVLAPSAIGELYSLRSELRGQEDFSAALSASEIIVARLAGRLSSISNSSFILQEQSHFRSVALNIDPLYFQRQVLAPLFGVGIIPEVIPERILINFFGGSFLDVSYMAGVPGNLALAWFIGPPIFLINLVTIVLMAWLSFYFANKLDLPFRNEVCFMLIMYPMTSGVGNEFSFIAVSMVALIVMFKLMRLIGFSNRRVVS